MAADLDYTTADVDFWEGHFKEPNYDSGDEEVHYGAALNGRRAASTHPGDSRDVIRV